MVSETLKSGKFAPIAKEKLNAFRGGGDYVETTGDGTRPARVNGQDVYYSYDCGYQLQGGTCHWDYYDANWNTIATCEG